MANPQRANGFTAIANEILEVMQQHKFTLNEIKLIMCIWRFTYGFNRKDHAMSLSFFENHTGLPRGRINKSLKDLTTNQVLFVKKSGTKSSNVYQFNKDYDVWKVEKYQVFTSSQDVTSTSVQGDTSVSSQDITSAGVQDVTSTSSQDVTSASVRNVNPRKKELKENIKKEVVEANAYLFYQQNIGMISPFQWQLLYDFVEHDGMEEAVLIEAMKQALLRNTPKINYIVAILKNWHKENVRTPVQALAKIREFENKKAFNGETPIPNYPKKEENNERYGDSNGTDDGKFGRVKLYQ